MSQSRVLDSKEIERLVKVERLKKKNEELKQATTWPSPENMIRLAEAVAKRSKQVDFENPFKRFKIKYFESEKVVYISPETGFVPCGHFEYYKLREVLNA